MPAGLSEALFFEWLVVSVGEDAARSWWKWLMETHPAWGRDGWRRLDDARAGCPGR